MKPLNLFLILLTTTLFLACSSDKEQLQVETNLTTYSEEKVDLRASGAKAYSWRQLSGIPVILIDANSATPSFIAPSVSTEEILIFELEAVTAQIQGESITLTKQVSVVVHPKAIGMESTPDVGDTDMHSTSGEVEREDGDGTTQTNELSTLKDAGVKSIDLNYVSTNITLGGATLTEASKYTDAKNNKELVADVNLEYNPILTTVDTSTIIVNNQDFKLKREVA